MANEVNLKEAAVSIFKTVKTLERSYGAEYLSRILQGFDRFGLKDVSHSDLETFGVLSELFRERIINMIKYLESEEYLKVSDARFGNLTLTEKGKAFLSDPQDLVVPNRLLNTNEWDRLLAAELRNLRREISDENDLMPYEIFTNFTLQGLVEKWPEQVSDLKGISGLGDAKADRYGQSILQAVKRTKEKRSEVLAMRREKRAKSPSYQKTKDLFLAGKTLEEIAEDRCIKPSTVLRYLETLHVTGEVDINAWIEKQVPAVDFEKGTSYFRGTEDRRLRSAYEHLGLDYETLRMCRLYVSSYLQSEEEMALAG